MRKSIWPRFIVRDPDKNADADELATKARKILTEDPELSETLAEINYRKKEYARAIQLLQESARRKPLNAKALFFLGMSQLQTKRELEGRANARAGVGRCTRGALGDRGQTSH